MENHDAAQGPKSLSGRKHHPHGARLRSSYATGLSGQAPKPHSMSVETTFSAVSAIEQELCRKGDRKNQRNGVKAERIEGQGERSSHGALRSGGA